MGTRIQMLAVSTGGVESALASIDIPKNGNLVGVEWAARCSFDTTGDAQTWQLAFGSVIASVNDSRQVISNCTMGVLIIGAAGIMLGGQNFFDVIPDIQVGAGERLYVHSNATAGVVGTALVMLSFDFDLDLPRARRR